MTNVEKNFLGCIMEHNHLISDTDIQPHHFSESINRSIYMRMKELAQQGKPIELSTMIIPGEQNSASYLMQLQQLENEANFEKYEAMILESYQHRAMRNVCAKVLEDEGATLPEVIAELGKLEMHSENDRHTAFQMAMRAHDLPYTAFEGQKGISTGLNNLNAYTGGLNASELTIVAARPSVGKTALAINLALGAARDNAKVVFFSLEMPEKQLTSRFLAHIGNIDLNRFKDANKYFTPKNKADWPMIIDTLSKLDLEVHDSFNQSMQQIRSKVRKAVREAGEKKVVVIIDYLSLIVANDLKANTHVQVSQISRDLKKLAREFNTAVVCLAQLNRGVEQRQDKRPMMSDLRESGSIEQDADIIALLYRDDYYNRDSNAKNVLEIIVAKNRNGSTGTVLANYDRATGIIRDIAIGGVPHA